MQQDRNQPLEIAPVSLWRLGLLPVGALAIAAIQCGIAMFQYRSLEPALGIGVMGGIVWLLALSISTGHGLIRRRRDGRRPAVASARLRFLGPFAALIGPQLLGFFAASSYFGRGEPLLSSIAAASVATAIGLAFMLPLMWWALSRLDSGSS